VSNAHQFWKNNPVQKGVRVNQPGNFHTVPAGVSTVGDMTVQRGGSVTIPCFYGDRYKTHVKYWCRGYNVRSCSPIVHSDSPQEGKVSIRDDPDQQVFTVTINSLTAGDSGTYWCGVEISGGSDVGASLYLSVSDGDWRGRTLAGTRVMTDTIRSQFILLSVRQLQPQNVSN
uniref:Ig-like domain-containing protein n=1 Tax=Paramormyrops kingsleyae TaxID=1676925 RepID=A0A3B3SMV3_9TELE